jgi:hypothetical protein
MEEPNTEPEEERRGLRRWGRAIAFGLSGLVLGGLLAFTLSAGAAEPSGSSGSSGSGTTSQSTTQSGTRDHQGQPCPEGAGGGGAPSQGTPQY